MAQAPKRLFVEVGQVLFLMEFLFTTKYFFMHFYEKTGKLVEIDEYDNIQQNSSGRRNMPGIWNYYHSLIYEGNNSYRVL